MGELETVVKFWLSVYSKREGMGGGILFEGVEKIHEMRERRGRRVGADGGR